jgi:phage recombination protein Bet
MSSEIAKRSLSDDDLKTLELAGVIPPNSDKAQVAIFARLCAEKSLSPFSKQAYLTRYNTKDGAKYTVIVGIDGYRSLASRTGLHAGTDDVRFNLDREGGYKTAAELLANRQLPTTATVTIYKVVSGKSCAFTHTCVFAEFSTGQQKWQTMPFQMIAKCAEGFALKKGFPDELAGVHIEEEMGAFEDKQVSARPVTAPHVDTTVVMTEEESTELAEKLADLTDQIAAMDTKQALDYWRQFKASELIKRKEFIIMVVTGVCSKLSDVDALSTFWKVEIPATWKASPEIKAIFTERRLALETAAKNG